VIHAADHDWGDASGITPSREHLEATNERVGQHGFV
jgi:hypothetical protein